MKRPRKVRTIGELRADYEREDGNQFIDFYCPILCKDEPTELCLGHVINKDFNDTEYLITQRSDVDCWYGSMFESDFIKFVKDGKKSSAELFAAKPSRALKTFFHVDGTVVDHYTLNQDSQELPINEHTLLEVNRQNGEWLRLAMKMRPEEMDQRKNADWGFGIVGDFRVAALVSMIKAAYLTLFWMHGYRYALSAAGLSVSRGILGQFFLANRDKSYPEVQEEAHNFFSVYRNMWRPVQLPNGGNRPGTIEDGNAFVWLGSSGQGLATGVFVRINEHLHCVLMPAYNSAEGAANYEAFLQSDDEVLHVREARFDRSAELWEVNPQRIPIAWPKHGESFDLGLRQDDHGVLVSTQ